MPGIPVNVMQRLNELIEMGAGIPHSPNNAFYADHTALTTWRTASIAFLERVVGPKDAYTRLFIQEADGWYYSAASSGTGILKQVKHDLEGDYLLRISQLVAGELVADVWSQAAELLDVHFKDAAANLAGAALEVGLRQIAMAHGVDVEGQRGIDALNRSLAKAQVFTAVATTLNTVKRMFDTCSKESKQCSRMNSANWPQQGCLLEHLPRHRRPSSGWSAAWDSGRSGSRPEATLR